MSGLPKTAVCPKCGRVLPQDAPQGLCTKCLVGAMLDTGPLAGALKMAVGKPVLPRAFGPYELLEEVARGGMGIVYKARQPQINRVVALKVMAAGQFAAPDFVKRFRTEAEAVASLEHPNIVPIYEVGECEGQPFFSMKFLEGGSLASRISGREFQISNHEAAVLLGKLARAVHFAHQHGILHRDLKPGNVLLDGQGEPQLTDFGLARLVDKESTLTRTIAMLGTPSYMSPEQARGEAKQLTTAVDVYGLGAVFYELLAGQPPFAGGTTMETVRQVLEKEPRRPSSLKPATDRDLETICLKCLEKDPARRYASAEALGADLERWERHEPVVARRPTAAYKLQKAWSRNKLAYSASIAVVLAVLAGLGLAAAGWRQAEHARVAAARQRDLAQDRLYDSLVREARSIRTIRPSGYRSELIDRIRQALAIPTAKRDVNVLRSEIAQCLGDALSLSPVSLVNPPAPASVLDFALDVNGTQVAFGTADGLVVLHETTTGAVIAQLQNQGRIVQLAFTPDGRRLFGRAELAGDKPAGTDPRPSLIEWRRDDDGSWATQAERSMPNLRALITTTRGVVAAIEDVARREIRMMEAETDRLVGTLPIGPGEALGSAFDLSRDESLAALSFQGGTNQAGTSIEVWDLAVRQRRIRLTPDLGVVPHVEFSPDARFLACTGDNGVIAYDTSEFKAVTTYRGYMSTPAAWAGKGTMLAIPLSQENGIRLFAVASGAELKRLSTRGEVKAVRTSLDGSVLVAVDLGGPVLATHLADTRERLHLTGHRGGVPAVEFSPDGRMVASTGKDETIRLWDSFTGKALQVWGDQHVEGQTVCFSPDGRWLASGNYRNNQIIVWSITDGQRVLVLGNEPPGDSGTWSCAFSSDGKILLAAGDGLRAWELVPRAADTTGSPLVARYLFRDPLYSRNLQIDPAGNRIAFQGSDRRDGRDVNGSFIRGLEPLNEPQLANIHSWAVQTLGFADGGRTLLNMDSGHTLHFWDLRSRQMVRTVSTLAAGEAGSTLVGNLRVSPDGSKVATANYSGLGVNIYDLASGRRLYSLPDETGSIWWLAWGPDNRRLAVSRGDGDISVWSLTEVESVFGQAGLTP